VQCGDGYLGWPEHAPFQAILVTASPSEIPQELVKQLCIGGRMLLPVGTWSQELLRVTKDEAGLHTERLLPVRFVPMVHGEETQK
jgi:protein-L-isoaspartate(D-aspartate) O-methyltransferase